MVIPPVLVLGLVFTQGEKHSADVAAAWRSLHSKTELGAPVMEGGNKVSEIFYKHSSVLVCGLK